MHITKLDFGTYIFHLLYIIYSIYNYIFCGSYIPYIDHIPVHCITYFIKLGMKHSNLGSLDSLQITKTLPFILNSLNVGPH